MYMRFFFLKFVKIRYRILEKLNWNIRLKKMEKIKIIVKF